MSDPRDRISGFIRENDDDDPRLERYNLLRRAAEAAQEVLREGGDEDIEVWLISRSKYREQVGTETHQREIVNTWASDYQNQLTALDVLADMTRGTFLAMNAWAGEQGQRLGVDFTKSRYT
jgi:hypothetical protein